MYEIMFNNKETPEDDESIRDFIDMMM